MIKELREIMVDYGIVGLVFGVLSIVIRPARPWLDNVKEVAAAVTLAIITGLLLRDSGLSDTTIYGIIGGCSCFARTIFEGIGSLVTHISEKPLYYAIRLLGLSKGIMQDDHQKN